VPNKVSARHFSYFFQNNSLFSLGLIMFLSEVLGQTSQICHYYLGRTGICNANVIVEHAISRKDTV
jgi:hypothetical protein